MREKASEDLMTLHEFEGMEMGGGNLSFAEIEKGKVMGRWI
jgi:hypothetical protein